MRTTTIAMVVTLAALVAACKPSEPPPDLVKTQREALEKAKAVEGQVLQAAQEQKRAIEAAEAGKAADTGK